MCHDQETQLYQNCVFCDNNFCNNCEVALSDEITLNDLYKKLNNKSEDE
jgi:hypothetical protein